MLYRLLIPDCHRLTARMDHSFSICENDDKNASFAYNCACVLPASRLPEEYEKTCPEQFYLPFANPLEANRTVSCHPNGALNADVHEPNPLSPSPAWPRKLPLYKPCNNRANTAGRRDQKTCHIQGAF
jgi:hypothetical protein